MALVVADRVWETTSTSGTGTLTLSGAVSGYQTFAVIGNGNTTYYTITNGTDWEVGIGTYTSSGTTLSRDTVLSSSLGGTKITVTPGSFVFVDYPASRAVYEDESGVVTGYPISGGTINNTSIGATTPSTVNATTLSGQTARVNGTGTNLLVQSSSLTTTWTQSNSSLTGGQSDPFGGTTAAILNSGTAVSTQHSFFQATSYASNTFTLSIYAKAGTANFVGIYLSNPNSGVIFNLSTGSFSTNIGTAPASFSITAVSGAAGWYRCSITVSGAQNFSQFFISEDGLNLTFTGTSKTIIVAAPQLEIGSTLNTYIPTTTTAVYGTPTLSFSGVSTIGLESNGALFLQPAGTGALQAQATTSTTVGGNARGANAVDWQMNRGSAGQVASGAYAVVSGGSRNQSSGDYSAINGGYNNSNQAYMGVIAGGQNNTNQGTYSFVGGGQSNSAQGLYTVIGGGWTNSGTTQAAVTTQSATMNGTTAVTLSGSNASIKVGQYISGTYINGQTYVAAISGTALTLSQVASGSGTATLSFFTPHGVVVGGGNNQATGSYSFIGGGGDAGTAANRNVASGDWSFVGGGTRNVASAVGSFIGGGGTQTGFASANTASGEVSAIVGGLGNNASATGSSIIGGYQNQASGLMSAVLGGRRGTTRGIVGNIVSSASNIPIFDAVGVSQAGLLILGVQTTDATATALRSDASAASTTNQVILPNNSAYYFKGSCIANVTGAANGAAWSFEGAIMRGANAASTVLIDTPSINRVAASAGATTWTIALTADTTNGGLTVTVTGVAATTIRWVAKVETTEVTF
jgi:hypothetical protein